MSPGYFNLVAALRVACGIDKPGDADSSQVSEIFNDPPFDNYGEIPHHEPSEIRERAIAYIADAISDLWAWKEQK